MHPLSPKSIWQRWRYWALLPLPLLVILVGAGLSPLARGNHGADAAHCAAVGPIPARAGQPPSALSSARWTRAYPRSRGATAIQLMPKPMAMGLSPLARGNLA